MPNQQFNFDAITDALAASNIAILDSIPGSGKTTAITEFLKLEDQPLNRHVLFITPFKSEAEIELPNNKLEGCGYRFPVDGRGGKVRHLAQMLKESLVPDFGGTLDMSRFTATHYCFCSLDSDAYDCLTDYTLIIDETLDVAGIFDGIGHYSIKLLEGHGEFSEESGQFTFTEDSWFKQALNDDVQQNIWNRDINYHFLKQVNKGMLYAQRKDNQLYCFRVLPKEVLSKAAKVIIMTHNFKYSAMDCWMRHHRLEYTYIDNQRLGLKSDEQIKADLVQNINLVSLTSTLKKLLRPTVDKSEGLYTLSQTSWANLAKSPNYIPFGKALNNAVRTKLTMAQDDLFWTVPKDYRGFVTALGPVFKGKPGQDPEFDDGFDVEQEDYTYGKSNSEMRKKQMFVDSYLPSNIKAINGYGHVTNCLYGVNLHFQPNYKTLLTRMYNQIRLTDLSTEPVANGSVVVQSAQSEGISKAIDDTYALNSLLQFIHRGSLRNGNTMKLLILSERIESLLKTFLPNLRHSE